jgi:hypothetical protein
MRSASTILNGSSVGCGSAGLVIEEVLMGFDEENAAARRALV